MTINLLQKLICLVFIANNGRGTDINGKIV